MEILSKFVGASASPSLKQAGFNSPQQRSIRFKKSHDQSQQLWRRYSAKKQTPPAEPILACLESMRTILQDEAQAPAPHLCAKYVSTFQAYFTLSQMSYSHNEYIFHEVLQIFKILIESEEVEFFEERGFADALITFISRISTTGPLVVSVDIENVIVEVLFGITAKLRLQPRFLPTWFRPVTISTDEGSGQENDSLRSKADKGVFPLFYLTLDYIHHDGRVGDFARTGLLYIVESAAHSETLEQWIVESDLATLMVSGLGALYSQLSRKLVLSFPKDSTPNIMAFSETPPPAVPPDAEETTSPEFQGHLATFLSYLVFWQDVLEHCKSKDIKQSLIDHFKYLFLQQLLYPSLIESSDVDGGSSVAVLTYLKCIIESISHIDLLNVTLEYLLAVPEKPQEKKSTPARPTTLAMRRKSERLISNLARGQEKPSPDLFTLVDLVQTSLQSRNQQTVTANLRLVSVILRNQHRYAVSSIIKTKTSGKNTASRSLAVHNYYTSVLFTMVEDLLEHDDLREAYETHLEDARTMVESHSCSVRLLALPIPAPTASPTLESVQPHEIRHDDPLVKSLTALLENFLTNDIATNLSLTELFSTMASCANTRLDPWLLAEPAKHQILVDKSNAIDTRIYDHHDMDDVTPTEREDTPSHGIATANSNDHEAPLPQLHGTVSSISPMFSTLDTLVQQVEKFRNDIQEFDTYLAERRHVFKVGEEIDQSVANDQTPSRRSNDSARTSASQDQAIPQLGSIPQRLRSEASSSVVSRSSSPRGRQPSDSVAFTLVGRLNHLRISPSLGPSQPASRPFSPSPLRKDSLNTTPPKLAPTAPAGPASALHQRFKVRVSSGEYSRTEWDVGSNDASSIRSSSVASEAKAPEGTREITLSHLLTNVIILQEFILELVAIVQVRASLFGEIEFE